jgi:tellurite resistance protein TerC
MEVSAGWWIGFLAFVVTVLVLDLAVFHRKSHEIGFKEALGWTAFWISLAMIFNLGILLGWFGNFAPEIRSQRAMEFLTGYLVEEALSMDNVFVFAVIFNYFAVPPAYRHRVLFYGILGALVFRGIFIFGGLLLLEKFEWMMYVFGGLLIITGIRLLGAHDKEIHPEKNKVIKLIRWFVPVTPNYVGGKFLVRENGRLLATPLLLVLAFVETTDIIFAVDSIPAIIAITREPFIVYTSNVFAILGLRALYFCLANVIKLFHYLSYGLALLLVVIGLKMLAAAYYHYHLPTAWSLGVVAGILGISIIASILFAPKGGDEGGAGPEERGKALEELREDIKQHDQH